MTMLFITVWFITTQWLFQPMASTVRACGAGSSVLPCQQLFQPPALRARVRAWIKLGRQQCSTVPAAVVPASGLASAVVYCAQRRQRKEDGLGVGRWLRELSHVPPCARSILRAWPWQLTVSPGRDEFAADCWGRSQNQGWTVATGR